MSFEILTPENGAEQPRRRRIVASESDVQRMFHVNRQNSPETKVIMEACGIKMGDQVQDRSTGDVYSTEDWGTLLDNPDEELAELFPSSRAKLLEKSKQKP